MKNASKYKSCPIEPPSSLLSFQFPYSLTTCYNMFQHAGKKVEQISENDMPSNRFTNK